MNSEYRILSLNEEEYQSLNKMRRDWARWLKEEGEDSLSSGYDERYDGVLIARISSPWGVPAATSPTTPGNGLAKIQNLWYQNNDVSGTAMEIRQYPPFYFGTGTGSDVLPQTTQVPVYNIDTENDFAEDDIVVLLPVAEGNFIILSSSTGTSTGEACPCSCISSGDITVAGMESSSRWTVTLPKIVERQLNGTIELPAGTYTVVWDEGNGYWDLDVGNDLVAYYNDGSDATGETTMDGTIVFQHDSGGYTKLCVTITGSVPNQSFGQGFADGYADGYDSGWSDGLVGTAGSWDGTGTGSGTGSQAGTADDEYRDGYAEGYAAGYQAGFADAQAAGTGTGTGTGVTGTGGTL